MLAALALAAPAAAPAQLFLNNPAFPTGPIERQRSAGRPAAARRDAGRISRPSALEPARRPQRRRAAMPVLALSAHRRQLQCASSPIIRASWPPPTPRSKAISAGSTAAPGRASSTSIRPRPTTISRRCRRSSASARRRRGSARKRWRTPQGRARPARGGADARVPRAAWSRPTTTYAFTRQPIRLVAAQPRAARLLAPAPPRAPRVRGRRRSSSYRRSRYPGKSARLHGRRPSIKVDSSFRRSDDGPRAARAACGSAG